MRRVWAKKGERPIVSYETRYEWTYLNGFVCPAKGETFWLLLPTVSLEAFAITLHEFAQWTGAGKTKEILLILDGAGFHEAGSITIPQGIHLHFLPPYSPELQPAEKLWPLSNEGVTNEHFKGMTELEDAQVYRCKAIATRKAEVKKLTLFHWWPQQESYINQT